MPRKLIPAAGVYPIHGLQNSEGGAVFLLFGTIGTAAVVVRGVPVGEAAPASGTGSPIRLLDLSLAAETYTVAAMAASKVYKAVDAGGLDLYLDVTGSPGAGFGVAYHTLE